jgi:tetratricopeptide (TPR) repeat protein
MPLDEPPSRIASIDRVLLVGTGLCLFALATHKLFAYDIWWQIASGGWIATHGLPDLDPFSYGFPGREWIEPRWLWCLLVYGVFTHLGVNFLIVLKLALLGMALGLFVVIGRGRPAWAVATGVTVILITAYERFTVRPELLSFVALMLVFLVLDRYRHGGSPRWLWVLPVLQLAWCNAHTLWILGPVTLWIVVVAEAIQSRLLPRGDTIAGRRLVRLGIVVVVTTLATLVNPYFLKGVLFPFGLFREISGGHMFSEAIAELRGPLSSYFFAADFRTVGYLTAIVVSAATFVPAWKRPSLARLGLWAAYLFLSIEAWRNVSLFGFVAGTVVMLNLGDASKERAGLILQRVVPWTARAVVAVFVLIMIPLVATDRFYRSQLSHKRFGFGLTDKRYPVRALEFVRRAGLPGHVLHTLGDGGYVLFEGGPGSVYADARLEVYGLANLEQAFQVTWSGEALEREADRTGVHVVLIRNDIGYRHLLRHLDRSPGWVPVYYDHLHLVYLRSTEATAALVERHAFEWSDPRPHSIPIPPALAAPDWLAGLWPRLPDAFADERLGSLFAGVGNYELALTHFEAAHRTDPRDRRTRMFLALFYEAQGRADEATKLLAGVPSGYLQEPSVHVLAGRIDQWANNPALAVTHFRRARELGSPEPEASLRLARAAILAGETETAGETLAELSHEHPDVADVWNLLAVHELKLGRPWIAVEHFERSLSVEPNQPEVRRRLEELR